MQRAERPWGQVRFEIAQGVARVGVSVADWARGHRGGPVLIRSGVRHLLGRRPDVDVVEAGIRPENAGSARSFRIADFVELDPSADGSLRFSYSRGRDGRD